MPNRWRPGRARGAGRPGGVLVAREAQARRGQCLRRRAPYSKVASPTAVVVFCTHKTTVAHPSAGETGGRRKRGISMQGGVRHEKQILGRRVLIASAVAAMVAGASVVAATLDCGPAFAAGSGVATWGSNQHGQLGDGLTGAEELYSDVPVAVKGLSEVVAVAQGPISSLRSAATARCGRGARTRAASSATARAAGKAKRAPLRSRYAQAAKRAVRASSERSGRDRRGGPDRLCAA